MSSKKRGRDRELEAGSRAHFEDPAYYAQSYAKRRDDVAYYVRVAQGQPSVLEYGIGSGRVALPIARAGSRVVGIDLSEPMLGDLARRLAKEPREVRGRVIARQGDMREVRLRERFPLVICPFNAALHLYTREDVEAWLARVREHLAPKGELVVDISMPILEDLSDPPGTEYALPSFVHPSAGPVKYREVFDYDRVRQISFCSMVFEPKKQPSFMVPLAHRQFFPQEWEALLHYNGFDATAVYGDFEGNPLVQSSDVMVWHARRSSRSAVRGAARPRGERRRASR
ncbi:MAG: class I SAM-dependent methyltransferase [Deltaproteobacteria bacterium]|nr:class I SAM-dependent methyltransferase [Deltaproteobacteria bacterium]